MKNKNFKKLCCALAGAVACLLGLAHAATISGGSGMGFDDSPIPWVSTVLFDKQDVRRDAAPLVVKTGDDVTPSSQKDSKTRITVPHLTATSWCDSFANPLIRNNEDFTACYGNALAANWYVLDLNALQKSGLQGIWIAVTAQGIDADLTQDHSLIAALTLFQGRQNQGTNLNWFPQIFQSEPVFWANQLRPFTGGSTRSQGWDSAYGKGSRDVARITGWVQLRPGGQNYLTVAIGGDARERIIRTTTDPNLKYAIAISVSKQQPGPASPLLKDSSTPKLVNDSTLATSGIARPTLVSNGVDITITNQLYETVQCRDATTTNWIDVQPSANWTLNGASTFGGLSISSVDVNTSHGQVDVECMNYWIGYPSCNITLPNHGDWSDVGYFSEGESVSTNLDGWNYTITRHSDGEGFAGSKNFELVIKDTTPRFTLVVSGKDGVSITNGYITSDPAGISCGADGKTDCQKSLIVSGTAIKLTATPSAGYSLANVVLTNCDSISSDNSECTVNMAADRTVTAQFLAQYTLTIAGKYSARPDGGHVTSSPEGLFCGKNYYLCEGTFIEGKQITLKGEPNPGYDASKTYWGGCDSLSADNSECYVTLSRNQQVTADFYK